MTRRACAGVDALLHMLSSWCRRSVGPIGVVLLTAFGTGCSPGSSWRGGGDQAGIRGCYTGQDLPDPAFFTPSSGQQAFHQRLQACALHLQAAGSPRHLRGMVLALHSMAIVCHPAVTAIAALAVCITECRLQHAHCGEELGPLLFALAGDRPPVPLQKQHWCTRGGAKASNLILKWKPW